MNNALNYMNSLKPENLDKTLLEAVPYPMNRFREPWRIKIAHGGRGSGAKSWSAVSILVQKAQASPLQICCMREIQKSLEESCYRLVINTIDRLGYLGWHITKEQILHNNGSRFIFRGLSDLRAAGQIKSLEGFDIFFLEEAATISHESLDVLLPTLRKPGSELWAVLNRQTEQDPIMRYWNSDRDDVLRLALKPFEEHNPFFPDILKQDAMALKEEDPELYAHIWLGEPIAQAERAILSRTTVREAVSRQMEAGEPDEIGADIARFGSDRTEIYRRQGGLIIRHKELRKTDTDTIANEIWDMADREYSVLIKVDDTGVGGGVTDRLKKLGAHVIGVNFGGSPKDKKRFTTVADELWFELPIHDIKIPDDIDLVEELCGRLYDYDKLGRKKVEPKESYKKRLGRSPDKADAFLLAFYNPVNKFAIGRYSYG